jgi:O-Antigen ligase
MDLVSHENPGSAAMSRHPVMHRELVAIFGILSSGLLIGYLSVNEHLRSAIVLAAMPLILWLLYRPRLAVMVLGITIPFPVSVIAGGPGLNVAASDVLLSTISCMVIAEALVLRRSTLLAPLRILAWPVAPYLGWMVVLVAAHLSVLSAMQSAQRLELFLFPILVGVSVAIRRHEMHFLRAYLVACTVFAALYPFFSDDAGGLGVQKNPAGGFIAGALLLLIGVRGLRGKLLLVAPVLTLGLFWTQSRGAILSVVVGLAVLLLMHPGRDRLRFLALLVPVSAIAAGAFALLPQAAQERNTSFSAGTTSRAGYAVELRETYRLEAWHIIHSKPLFGTGIGQYFDGVNGVHPTTVDPHQVLLLQAAEGGYPLGVAFVVLVLGSAGVIAWRGRRTVLGPAAVALLISAVGHGLVDVYWARGTPVLGWLVVGMALGQMSSVRERVNPEVVRHSQDPAEAMA